MGKNSLEMKNASGEYTEETMGMAETLIAQCLIGIIWGLFAAQPLIVQSPTGPVLIFEAALYGVGSTSDYRLGSDMQILLPGFFGC